MEWQEPAIVLETTAYGEGDYVVTVLTPNGVWRGLAKGGASRRQNATWQKGNLLSARWVARLAEQLGALTGELVHPAAALAMQDRDNLAILDAACALAAGALPEREPHGDAFAGLARLLAGIDIPNHPLPELVRWEIALLRELGFGLDFSAQAGGNDRLGLHLAAHGPRRHALPGRRMGGPAVSAPAISAGRFRPDPGRLRGWPENNRPFFYTRRFRRPPPPPSNGARASL